MKGKRLGRAERSRGEGRGARRRGAGRSAAGGPLPWDADRPGTPAPELEPLGRDARRRSAASSRRAMRGCGAGAGLPVPPLPPPLLLLGVLLAAAPGAALGKETAFVEVVLFESSPSGDYTTYTTGLQGRFSRAGATLSAEGEIVQVSAAGGRRLPQDGSAGPAPAAQSGAGPAAPRAPRGPGRGDRCAPAHKGPAPASARGAAPL